jgi:hypothetical protein
LRHLAAHRFAPHLEPALARLAAQVLEARGFGGGGRGRGGGCGGCGASGQAVVLVTWAPQCESQVLDPLAEGMRSYRITEEASYQIATQMQSDRSKISRKDAPR